MCSQGWDEQIKNWIDISLKCTTNSKGKTYISIHTQIKNEFCMAGHFSFLYIPTVQRFKKDAILLASA
jgi:hypothetical protein